jgi:hypothetical protein
MNTINVAYHVNHRAVLTTTIQLGANPALVTDQCWQHVYGYPTGKHSLPSTSSPTFRLTQKGVASLVDGGLQQWSPPVSNVGNRAEEMESLTQMYNQMLDANSIMATGAPVRQSGALPASIEAQLPEADHFSTSMLDQEQPQSQAQAPNESVVAHVGSFQDTQSMSMAGSEPGDLPGESVYWAWVKTYN